MRCPHILLQAAMACDCVIRAIGYFHEADTIFPSVQVVLVLLELIDQVQVFQLSILLSSLVSKSLSSAISYFATQKPGCMNSGFPGTGINQVGQLLG